jgi:CelD/BcsL family acetyltransferase involved in cellulose biosynthesis
MSEEGVKGERMPGKGAAVPESSIRVDLLDPDTALARHRAAWAALAATEGVNAYALPCAFDAWRRTLAAGTEASVLVALRGEELAGVMPVMQAVVRRGPSFSPRHDFAPADRIFLRPGPPRPFRLRQISPVVSVAAMMTTPAVLCLAADRRNIVHAMAARLAALPRWDVFVAPVSEPEQGDWLEGLHRVGLDPWIHPLHRTIMGLARVVPFDAVVEQQNRNFRRNVRRARAEAERIGLVFEIHQGAAAAAHLGELAEIAGASWKVGPAEEIELTVPYEGAQRRFYEALADGSGLATDGATPLIVLAKADRTLLAAALCIRCGNRMTGCLTFHNPIFPKASPGLLVVGRAIDWAAEQGLARFDLNGSHEWIRHLSDEGRAVDNVMAFAPTLRGRGFRLVHRMLAALRQARERPRSSGGHPDTSGSDR